MSPEAPRLRALLEVLEEEGHDVMELREELAHLLRAMLRARHRMHSTDIDKRHQ